MGFSAVPFNESDQRAGERRAQRIDIVQTFRTVEPGMDEDRVAGLGLVHPDRRPVTAALAVVGGLDADKTGLLPWAFMVGGIDVEDAPSRVGFRFGARGHRDALLRRARSRRPDPSA